MKSLVLSRFRPGDPDAGAALRNLQNIYGLSQYGAVDVLSLNLQAEEWKQYDHVRTWQHIRLKAERGLAARVVQKIGWITGCSRHPSLNRYDSKEARNWLAKQCAQECYRLALVEELSLAHYIPFLKQCGVECVIFDAHNVEGRLRDELDEARSQDHPRREQKLAQFLCREEQQAADHSDQVWCCSEVDAALFAELYHCQSLVVPNSIRVQNYDNIRAIKSRTGDWSDFQLTLLFLGSYNYYPNEEAALFLIREVLPLLQQGNQKVEILIVGRQPTTTMVEAAQHCPEVKIVGEVESVLPYLGQRCVACLPIRLGSGTRLKILECFAAETPVVSTAKGAEGLGAKDRTHLLLAETAEQFALSVREVWDQQSLRQSLTKQAFDLVYERYSWEAAALEIEKAVRGA